MFFVLWRTAAFEADQGKVCDSLGALLLSALYSTELKLAQNTVLCSSRLADNTCTFEANLWRYRSLCSLCTQYWINQEAYQMASRGLWILLRSFPDLDPEPGQSLQDYILFVCLLVRHCFNISNLGPYRSLWEDTGPHISYIFGKSLVSDINHSLINDREVLHPYTSLLRGGMYCVAHLRRSKDFPRPKRCLESVWEVSLGGGGGGYSLGMSGWYQGDV